MNSDILYRRLNKFAEGRVFKSADGLSVTTEETARIYADFFPFCEKKLRVIPPLVSPDCLQASRTAKAMQNTKKIRLVYVGNFHHRLREPETYIRTIERVIAHRGELAERIELHFFGDADLVAECLEAHPAVKMLCRFHGRSSRKTVMEAMRSADVFVNIGNVTSYQLPSKVIEYACFGKPILNFTSSARDSSAAFLSTYPLLQNIHAKGGEADGEVVADFLQATSGQRMDQSEVDEFVSPYKVDNIAEQYLTLLTGSPAEGADDLKRVSGRTS